MDALFAKLEKDGKNTVEALIKWLKKCEFTIIIYKKSS